MIVGEAMRMLDGKSVGIDILEEEVPERENSKLEQELPNLKIPLSSEVDEPPAVGVASKAEVSKLIPPPTQDIAEGDVSKDKQ